MVSQHVDQRDGDEVGPVIVYRGLAPCQRVFGIVGPHAAIGLPGVGFLQGEHAAHDFHAPGAQFAVAGFQQGDGVVKRLSGLVDHHPAVEVAVVMAPGSYGAEHTGLVVVGRVAALEVAFENRDFISRGAHRGKVGIGGTL